MTKHYCDRCKGEIGTDRSKVYVHEVGYREYELCERCSKEISKWWTKAQISGEELIKNVNKWVRE